MSSIIAVGRTTSRLTQLTKPARPYPPLTASVLYRRVLPGGLHRHIPPHPACTFVRCARLSQLWYGSSSVRSTTPTAARRSAGTHYWCAAASEARFLCLPSFLCSPSLIANVFFALARNLWTKTVGSRTNPRRGAKQTARGGGRGGDTNH